MKLKHTLYKTLVSWILLCLVLTLTDPYQLSVGVLIVPFVLVYLALYYSWQLFSGWLVGRQSGGVKTGRAEWTKKIAVSCALVIVFTLVLGSLGQLTWRDTITLLILFAVGCFYILRMAKRT